jgi:hypothetical protein
VSRRDERGVTMIELVFATVITSIIVLPLGASVFLAMKTIPQSGERSERAAERFFLTDTFARDTANAATIAFPVGTASINCPATPPATPQKFYEVSWNDAGAVTVKYEATFAAVGPGSTRRVVITRTENGVPKQVATGVCETAPTPENVITVTNELAAGDLHRRVHAVVRLRPRGDMPVEINDFEGALGKTR